MTDPSNLNYTNKTCYNHRKTVSINNNDFINNNSINSMTFNINDYNKRNNEININDKIIEISNNNHTNDNNENNSENDQINISEEIDIDINDSVIQAVNIIKKIIGKMNILISGYTVWEKVR